MVEVAASDPAEAEAVALEAVATEVAVMVVVCKKARLAEGTKVAADKAALVVVAMVVVR